MNGKLNAAQRAVMSKLGKSDIEQPVFTGRTLAELLQKWAAITRERLTASLENTPARGRNRNPGYASGSLWQSLGNPQGTTTEERANEVILRMTANESYQWVDEGRRPTTNSGDGALRRNLEGLTGWISSKGIQVGDVPGKTREEVNRSLAYAIAKKIHAKGYPGTGFFRAVINDATFEELGEYLGESLGEQIALNVNLIKEEVKPYR